MPRRLLPRRRVFRALLALGAVAVVVVVVGGALCKLVFDCHLRGGSASFYGQGLGSTGLLPGFRQSVVARGFTLPTDFALLPDGRILVSEKNGLVELVENGRVLPAPFLDLRKSVATDFLRGIVAIQVDPQFRENGYVYVLYVQRDRPGKPPKGKIANPTTVRLIRVVARGDRAKPGSQVVLLGAAGHANSCTDLPATADCLPSDVDHDGGDIEFAKDGTLFVSTGDGGGNDEAREPTAVRAQSVDALGGKILHVTRAGKGVPSNPFWNGDPGANRSKVWALGLRNPFRLTLRPGSETPYVGDVGTKSFDEIDAAPRGANLGWPCYEGDARHTLYQEVPVCRALYAKGRSAVQSPSLALGRDVASSVTGGVFYTGSRFPEPLRGAYIFGDWAKSTLRAVRLDARGRALDMPELFASRAAGPVKLHVGPNGDLYYLALNAGELRRIRYTPR